MKKTGKTSFLAGFLAALLLCALVSPAMAVDGKNITIYPGIKVFLNDMQIIPKDAGGNTVDVFSYNGTTYLPVRAISNALDIPVQWDGANWSVYLGKHTGTKPAVMLSELEYYDKTNNGEFVFSSSGKDNTGETYSISFNRKSKYSSCYQSYLLNGQYTSLSGVFYQPFNNRSDKNVTTLAIYGDGEPLYTADMQGGVLPINFNVDITGVLILRIELSGYSGCGCVGDCGLWT